MTLREKIADIIDDADGDDPLWEVNAADAILAEIREHMTTETTVCSILQHMDDLDGRDSVRWIDLRDAILAALGDKP